MAQIDFNRPISERNEVLNKTHANALPSLEGERGEEEELGWLVLASYQAVNLLKDS